MHGQPKEQLGQRILGTVEVPWVPSPLIIPLLLFIHGDELLITKLNVVSWWGVEGLPACQPWWMLLGGTLHPPAPNHAPMEDAL